MSFDTPILYLIFNRPDLVKETFPQIRRVRPKQLFIAADGPRSTYSNDMEKCQQCRDWVMAQIDWECEVQTLFRDENLGCGLAVSGAISWFFRQVSQGIILEDDCIAHPSFFLYCESLLNKYEHEEKIMHIAGCNMNIKNRSDDSYYFGIHNHVWGWATWRRAWKLFDYEIINKWSFEDIKNCVDKYLSEKELRFWENEYFGLKEKGIDTWDIRWTFSLWINEGIAILPKNNMIKNIGFGSNATHTVHIDFRANLKLEGIGKLTNNENISVDRAFIRNQAKRLFIRKEVSILDRVKSFLKKSIQITLRYLKWK